MPLEDLIELGYEVARPPEGMPGDMPEMPSTAWRYSDGQQWFVNPGDDEEAIVLKAKNHHGLAIKLDQMQQVFTDNFNNWPTMTAQQKDTANRQAQRAIANLAKYARNDLSSEGT